MLNERNQGEQKCIEVHNKYTHTYLWMLEQLITEIPSWAFPCGNDKVDCELKENQCWLHCTALLLLCLSKTHKFNYNCVCHEFNGQCCSKFSREPQVEQKVHWYGYCDGCGHRRKTTEVRRVYAAIEDTCISRNF